jgi:L,D-peptidoglycan transpeptidase YkuD (ErfK/YbiS/YcfS/YnhG family)
MHNSNSCLQLFVRTVSACATRGTLDMGYLHIPCALGRTGCRMQKSEGDGATPRGAWAVREAFFRADRLPRPATALNLRAIQQSDGWCDGARDANYNRHITHPYKASAEHLWREDGLYDVIVVLGYNDKPPIKGKGSAIFLHCARPDFAPTQGCIAIARADLIKLLPRLTPRTQVIIP